MNILTLGSGITDFCQKMANVVQLIGYILLVFKIAIPLIIIALGMFDFGKAVVAEKEDEVKKQTKRLIYRIVAGIVIFFIPTIVMFLFDIAVSYDTEKEEAGFDVCQQCILSPGSAECKTKVSASKN